jgi:hypothetical protein
VFSSSTAIFHEDHYIPAELVGRLHRAPADQLLELVLAFGARDRARLAMHCYRKTHLRQVGLKIASTCDLNSLVREWGSALGRTIYARSREDTEVSDRCGDRPRPLITLARSAGEFSCYQPGRDLGEHNADAPQEHGC